MDVYRWKTTIWFVIVLNSYGNDGFDNVENKQLWQHINENNFDQTIYVRRGFPNGLGPTLIVLFIRITNILHNKLGEHNVYLGTKHCFRVDRVFPLQYLYVSVWIPKIKTNATESGGEGRDISNGWCGKYEGRSGHILCISIAYDNFLSYLITGQYWTTGEREGVRWMVKGYRQSGPR